MYFQQKISNDEIENLNLNSVSNNQINKDNNTFQLQNYPDLDGLPTNKYQAALPRIIIKK